MSKTEIDKQLEAVQKTARGKAQTFSSDWAYNLGGQMQALEKEALGLQADAGIEDPQPLLLDKETAELGAAACEAVSAFYQALMPTPLSKTQQGLVDRLAGHASKFELFAKGEMKPLDKEAKKAALAKLKKLQEAQAKAAAEAAALEAALDL